MCAYEAGYNNPAWASQRHASILSSGNLRRNPYMPYAAAQVEAADQIAGVGGGAVVNGMINGFRAVAPPPKPKKTLAQTYQEQADLAKAANEKRYGEINAGLGKRYEDTQAMLMKEGPPTQLELDRQRDRARQDALDARNGVQSSTLMTQRAEDFKRGTDSMDFDKRMRIMQTLNNLQGEQLGFQERREDTGPDMSQFIGLEQARGQGSMEGLAPPQSGGPPVIHGNPYGIGGGGGGGGSRYGQVAQQGGGTGNEVAYVDGNGIPRNAFGGQVGAVAGTPQSKRMKSYQDSRDATAAEAARRRLAGANPAYAAAANNYAYQSRG